MGITNGINPVEIWLFKPKHLYSDRKRLRETWFLGALCLQSESSCALHRELFLNITIISRNLLHLPTSVNSYQDTVSHILVLHQWQVCLMHNLIRDYILQILFSSYLISLSFNQLFATKIRSISISSPCHFYFVLYCFI